MNARAIAWLVLAAGMSAATPGDAPSPPLTVGPYRLLWADLHVHAYPGDGALPPWDIRREAARRGLDVVAITNHNQMRAPRLDAALFRPPAHPILLPGMELTTPNFHVSAVGIRAPIDWRLPLPDAIRAIQAQGGVAIGAHPATRQWERLDDRTLASFDGLEVAHIGRMLDATARVRMDAAFERARRLKPAMAAIGASDFHFGAGVPIGACRTAVFVTDVSAAGVLAAIRAGRTVAYDSAGRPFGDPDWIARAAQAGAASRNVAPATGWRHHVAMAGAWFALVFLVVCRSNSPRTGL